MKITEYRVVSKVCPLAIARSGVSTGHDEHLVNLDVRLITTKKGAESETTGRKRRLRCSITQINNDKKPDGMLFINGYCVTLGKCFNLVMTREKESGGYGLLTVRN